MKKWYMIVDVEKCEDCNNCLIACKDEHVDNEWPGCSLPQPRHGQRWINIIRKERGQYPLIDVAYLPAVCMHCDDAPCIKASKGAVYKRADGIVIIDPVKAKGRKELVKSCPYQLIWWNEEHEIAQKCTFCAHLIDGGWKKPRCVQSCPTGALRVEYIEEPEMCRVIQEENLECLTPACNTRPRIYYKNLYRYSKCFIAGSVAFNNGGTVDCAEGARVALFQAGGKICEMLTDNYGDFKFDHLDKNSGKYILEIEFKDYDKKMLELELKESLNVGTICF
ncbi:MAG: oxidoreductase [Peptococcaceae bacterium]|nr:oxidoreductase [Peptococcaceae bacterium]